jgi:UDPglucose 6-dehydrogenase
LSKPVIGFAGLTHLGLCSAAAAAAYGFDVVGFHDDATLVANLTRGILPISEPGLEEAFSANGARLQFSNDDAALASCDLVYIAVDVPTDEAGASDLRPITEMTKTAMAAMSDDALLVILCQVPPGFTREINRAPDRLYYQVETLIFGRGLERAMSPERIILGCANPDAPLDARLKTHLEAFNCPILPMRYESAELAKISINMCLVASIGVANTMAELCEQIGADWSEIIPALRLDRRIGAYSYISPGLGIAGGNLERDLVTVTRLAETHGTDHGIVDAWLANSRHRKGWAWSVVNSRVLQRKPDATIAVLGLAYKENTRSTKNSPSLALLRELKGRTVRVHDPVVPADEAGIPVEAAIDAMSACSGADAVAVMTPWPEYGNITAHDLSMRMRGRTVIDPYRILNRGEFEAAGLDYVTLGAAPDALTG